MNSETYPTPPSPAVASTPDYQPAADRPLGILDSGVGGLSVLAHLRDILPAERLLYFADQAHIPYGPRPLAEVRHFTAEITRFLLRRECSVRKIVSRESPPPSRVRS